MKPLIPSCLLWGTVLMTYTVALITETEVNSRFTFKIPEETRDPRFDIHSSELVAESVLDFATKLSLAFDNEYPNTQIFSPLSIMSSLALLYMGAKGSTHKQLSKLFPFFDTNTIATWKIHEEFGWLLEDVMLNRENRKRPRDQIAWKKTPANANAFGTGGKKTPSDHVIRIANGLFLQHNYSLRPDYQQAAESVYSGEVTPLDFRYHKQHAKHYINSWVNQNTLGKIPAIIVDELEADTTMILASALYFKGYWEQPFLGSGTAESNFFPDGPDALPVKVQMMGTGGVYPYYDSPELNCRIIGLPYKGNQTTMYIIQPHGSTRYKLVDFQNNLTSAKINDLINKMEQKTAVMAFPKFHITNTFELKKPLIKLGFIDIFESSTSDFSLIVDDKVTNRSKSRPSAFASASVSSSFNDLGDASIIQTPPQSYSDQSVLQQVLPESISPAITEKSLPDASLKKLPFSESTTVRSTPSTKKESEDDHQRPIYDRYSEKPLIFLQFDDNTTSESEAESSSQHRLVWTQDGDLFTGTEHRTKRDVTYKVESEFSRNSSPLSLKDLILSKRITKHNPGKKLVRNRRDTALPESVISLQNLDRLRSTNLPRPQLYADQVIHKVDFNVNEQGTEAAAATLTYLRRSGTDVAFRCDAPFLVLVRHDPTQLPLFYGKVNIPVS